MKSNRRCLALCLLLGMFAAPRPTVAETAVARGAYLVEGIANCGNCHAPQEPSGALPLTPLSGGPAITTPAFTAYPSNITPDKASGIGGWTEDQLVTTLREGHTPDNRMLRPPMPISFYRSMSDDDAHAIAAYILSRPAVFSKTPASDYKIPTPASYGPPLGHIVAPSPEDKVAYGAYLASIGHCMLCHTPIGANGQRDYAHRLGAGGWIMQGSFPRVVTANITPDKETGIGNWTAAEISRALTRGERPDGRHLGPPMPVAYLARLNPDDRSALIAWLRSLQPVTNRVEH